MDQRNQFIALLSYVYTHGTASYCSLLNHGAKPENAISPNDLNYLNCIGENSGITVSGLAEVMNISKPGATQIVNALQKKGLVRKVLSSRDRRQIALYLTSFYEKRDRYAENVLLESFYDPLTGVEKQMVHKILKSLKGLIGKSYAIDNKGGA